MTLDLVHKLSRAKLCMNMFFQHDSARLGFIKSCNALPCQPLLRIREKLLLVSVFCHIDNSTKKYKPTRWFSFKSSFKSCKHPLEVYKDFLCRKVYFQTQGLSSFSSVFRNLVSAGLVTAFTRSKYV